MSDLIERQEAIDALSTSHGILYPIRTIEALPPAQSEIIECKDCKYRGEKPIAGGRYLCNIHGAFMYYCSDAERRKEDDSN